MGDTESNLGDLEQSAIIEEDSDVGEVEKPKKAKRPLTDYQRANLEKGRAVRKQRGEEKRKAEAEALEKAVAEKAEKENVKIHKKAEKIVSSLKVTKDPPIVPSIPKLRRKQVIVLQSDTESDEDQIIIRRSKKKEKPPPSPPPPEPEEPDPPEESPPEPVFRRLKRV